MEVLCYEWNIMSLDPQVEAEVLRVAVKSLYCPKNNQRNELKITGRARKQIYKRTNEKQMINKVRLLVR